MEEPVGASAEFAAFNYCVCFIDILGQRDALRGQGVLPSVTTEEGRLQFVQGALKDAIGPILKLQEQAKGFVDEFAKPDHSPLRQTLSLELQEEWDKIQGHEIHLQYWSDGLVAFSCLGNREVHYQINGAFALLRMAGALCFLNLSSHVRNPLRGGIEIAWGAELRPGELYGPAIARSYELESEVAQYPRIAVGEEMISFLESVSMLGGKDNYSRYSSTLAQRCLRMLIRDLDGRWMIHYLGPEFRENLSFETYTDMYREALEFISAEYDRFRELGNSKLAVRYLQLLSYYRSYPPS